MLCHRHLVHLSSRDHFIRLHIVCSHVDPSPSNTSMHSTSSPAMDSALITRSSLYNSNNGQSVLNSVNRSSYITIKSSGIRTEPWWTSTPKLLAATNTNYCPAFHVLDHAMHQSHQLLIAHYLPAGILYINESDVEWLVGSHVQLL